MIVLWMKLREQGYQRSYRSMLREIRRLRLRPAGRQGGHRKPKPYQRAAYAGQKVQIDVKYVPGRCIADGQAYYQYTAIDECTRLVYREMYDEHSTYSSHDFLCKLIQTYPFAIREIQTDNGSEWTNALKANKPEEHLTLFEAELARQDILYHRIRVATPRHNGKVERQHRVDEVRFYSKLRMYSLADGRKQMQTYNRYSNTIPKLCLGLKSPNEVLALYLGVM
jgi:IS30 family transposase